jgi:plasmid maintenance system antidote protein VapI
MAARFHPAEFIIEELGARDWDPMRIAMAMDGDPTHNALVVYMYLSMTHRKMRMGERLRAGLSRAFGTSEELFQNLENSWLAETEEAS